MKWLKRFVWILVAAGIVAAIALAYRPRPVRVETATVQRGRMSVMVETEAKTRVHDRYVISAPLVGQLARIDLVPGDEVREGAVVARVLPAPAPLLDPRARDEAQAQLRSAEDARMQAQATMERAHAASDLAQQQATRERTLFEQDAAPRMALDQAEAEARGRAAEYASSRYALLVAGHAVETARAMVGRFEPRPHDATAVNTFDVLAPTHGRVLRVMQQSAGVVNAGTPLLEVGDPSALEIVADVLTEDAVRITPGAHVAVVRWGGDGPLDARVRLIEPSAFTKVSALGVEEQRVNVIVDLLPPSDRWRSLGDGYRVAAQIETWATDDAIQVAEGAVFRVGDRWGVFVVDAGRARRRSIEIGHRNGTVVEVLRGLRSGERVVLHPADTIAEGTAVRGD